MDDMAVSRPRPRRGRFLEPNARFIGVLGGDRLRHTLGDRSNLAFDLTVLFRQHMSLPQCFLRRGMTHYLLVGHGRVS